MDGDERGQEQASTEADEGEVVTEWNWPFIGGAAAIVIVLGAVVLFMSLKDDNPPPTTTTTTVRVTTTMQLSAQSTIADLLPLDQQFTTLLALASADGVLDQLGEDGPLTVFAPDESTWPADLPDPDTDPEGAAALLRRHIVADQLRSEDLVQMDGSTITTLSGDELLVEIGDDRSITVGGAKVIKREISASNGVIYVIDGPVTTAG
jgi:uncharacterized surface protein with fasciclin (FAS1) repeats